MHSYEVRPCNDHRGVDLISDALPFGRLGYREPNAISNAIGFAKFNSRSHDAVIRIFDEVGNVIETHDQSSFVAAPSSGETWLIEGRVAQFVSGGILVHTFTIIEVGMRQMPDGSTVYVAGNFDRFADGDIIKLYAVESGRYSFDDTKGANSMVRAFVAKKLFQLPPGQM